MIQTQSVFVRKNSLTMKRVGAVESESVKSARKVKDKFHKHVTTTKMLTHEDI